nr:hypothetical protein Iba_chr07fCG4070 [Ipomoea batatas]
MYAYLNRDPLGNVLDRELNQVAAEERVLFVFLDRYWRFSLTRHNELEMLICNPKCSELSVIASIPIRISYDIQCFKKGVSSVPPTLGSNATFASLRAPEFEGEATGVVLLGCCQALVHGPLWIGGKGTDDGFSGAWRFEEVKRRVEVLPRTNTT